MRFLLPAILCLVFATRVHALDVDYAALSESQRAILDKTTFELRILPPTALFPSGESPKDLSTDGFLIFVCSARENLGKRLLWIDAEVEFSNGYKRSFRSISFHLLTGSEVAIAKLDFPATQDLKVTKLKIASAPVK